MEGSREGDGGGCGRCEGDSERLRDDALTR
jgi:hypothetical protein